MLWEKPGFVSRITTPGWWMDTAYLDNTASTSSTQLIIATGNVCKAIDKGKLIPSSHKPTDLGCESVWDYYCLHPLSPLSTTQPESWHYVTIPWRSEGWVNLNNNNFHITYRLVLIHHFQLINQESLCLEYHSNCLCS